MKEHITPTSELSKYDFSKNEKALKSMKKPESKQERIANQIEQLAKHPKNKEILYKLVSTIDKTSSMKSLRTAWNKLPKNAQLSAITFARIPGIGGPIEYMIKVGLLNYKGHLDEQGEVMEKKVAKLGGAEKILLKYGIKVGALFFPELRPIVPLIKPIMKIEEHMGNNAAYVRQRLHRERIEQKNVRREIKGIAHNIRDQANKNYLN